MTSNSNSNITQDTSFSCDKSWVSVGFNFCEYCGVSEEHHQLIQCQDKNCGRWFCNYKMGLIESHIICHLRLSNHRAVAVPPEPSTLLCCVNCNQSNIFGLSVILYRQKKILVCTETCMDKKNYPGYAKNPIVQEFRISTKYLEWDLAKEPKPLAKVKLSSIKYIEREWRREADKNNPLNQDDVEELEIWRLPQVCDWYESETAYKRIFTNLLWAEEKYQREVARTWKHDKVKIMFKLKNEVLYGELSLSNVHHFGGRLKVDDKLQIEGEEFSRTVSVRSASKNEKIQVSFTVNTLPSDPNGEFVVGFVWMNNTYSRMREGLQKFGSGDALSKELTSYILGKPLKAKYKKKPLDLSFDFSEFDRFKLNKSQIEAAQKAIQAPYLFLIQGPPGTGKTQTLLAIIAQVIKNLNELGKQHKILICASSNKAVNNIAERLVENGIRGICRMFAVSKEHKRYSNAHLEKIALHRMIQENNPRLKILMEKKQRGEYLPLKELQEMKKMKKEEEELILKKSRIICCTCSVSADERLENFFFKQVFIDEASQSIEPECLLPLLHGAEKIIFAGDHKQIGPLITCSEAKAAGLNRSMFERLIQQADYHMLEEQYRMHPFIATFPSKHFYENSLKTSPKIKEERQLGNKLSCFKASPAYFYHVPGAEEITSTGVSLLNREEGAVVKKLLYGLVQLGVKPRQIGIITFYNGQKAHLLDLIENREDLINNVEISSVDGFQGGEKDFIIISCVRSNNESGIGFLSDEKRLNVAITRARYGMIIVGNAEVLCQDENWRALLEFYDKRNLVVHGDLNNFVRCNVKINTIMNE